MAQSKLVQFLFLCIVIASCTGKSKTIDICSHQIKDPNEKAEILGRYLTNNSGIIEAEYCIWYQDNSGGLVPGPSDYRIKLALKVTPDSLIHWTKGLKPSEKEASIGYWNDLRLNPDLWKLNGKPEYFFSESIDEVKIVYREQGIVLAVYSSMPVNLDVQ